MLTRCYVVKCSYSKPLQWILRGTSLLIAYFMCLTERDVINNKVSEQKQW